MTKLYMQKAGKNKQVSLKQGLVDRADTCTSSTMSRNYTIQLLRLGNLLGSILVVAPATNTNSRHSRCTTPARRQPCICSPPYYFALHTGNHMGGLRPAFPSKPTWGVHDIPDLTSRVILVTGACLKQNKYACTRVLNWTWYSLARRW